MNPSIRLLAVSLGLLAAPAAFAQSFSIAGTCGAGPMDFDIMGITPSGNYAIISADNVGSASVPAGPCAGTPLGLSTSGIALRVVRQADGAGDDFLTPNIPPAVCGNAYAQVLDLTTCTTSNVVLVDTPPSGGTLTAGDTSTVVTGTGIDGTGDFEFRCLAWDGDTCTDLEVRTAAGTCSTYSQDGVWHDTIYFNSPEERICPLICKGTTQAVGGDETFSECGPGTATVGGTHRAYGWSTGTPPTTTPVCEPDSALFREDTSFQGAPWEINVKLGTAYSGQAQLRLSCNGWN